MSDIVNFDQYLNCRQAAELLGVKHPTLRMWCRRKKNVPFYKHPVTGKMLFLRQDLENFLNGITCSKTSS